MPHQAHPHCSNSSVSAASDPTPYYAHLENLINSQAETITKLEARIFALEWAQNNHHHHYPHPSHGCYQPYQNYCPTADSAPCSPETTATNSTGTPLVGLGIMSHDTSPSPRPTSAELPALNNGAYYWSAVHGPPPPPPRPQRRRIIHDPPTPPMREYEYAPIPPALPMPKLDHMSSLSPHQAPPHAPSPPISADAIVKFESPLMMTPSHHELGRTSAEDILDRNAAEQIRAWTEQVEGGASSCSESGSASSGSSGSSGRISRRRTKRRPRTRRRIWPPRS